MSRAIIAEQKINFTPSNFELIRKGKRTTIRLGTKSLQLGLVALVCDEIMDAILADISEIRVIRFGDIGLLDAAMDGFNSVSELRSELQNCYQTIIGNYDVVTIIRFNLC